MCAASTSGAPLVNTNNPLSPFDGMEHSTIVLILFNAEEKGYRCLTFATRPLVECTTQHRDDPEELDAVPDAPLIAALRTLSL